MATRGERLQAAFAARGIRKQYALATALGVHESAITRWKNDDNMSVNHVISLCRELDISADWLLMEWGTMDQHRRGDDGREPVAMAPIYQLGARSLQLLVQFVQSVQTASGSSPAGGSIVTS